jgi:hypothetical protein
MDSKQIKQKVAARIAAKGCGSSLVLAGFSSIYACRHELRV